jgi:hypothetical protein
MFFDKGSKAEQTKRIIEKGDWDSNGFFGIIGLDRVDRTEGGTYVRGFKNRYARVGVLGYSQKPL